MNRTLVVTLLITAFAGTLGALILRSVVKIAANRLHSTRPLAEYDCADTDSENKRTTLRHAYGEPIADPSATNGTAWLHTVVRLNNGEHTIYGPYTNDLGRPGYIRVRFRIAGEGFERIDDEAIVLDVVQTPYVLQETHVMLGRTGSLSAGGSPNHRHLPAANPADRARSRRARDQHRHPGDQPGADTAH